MVVVSLTTEQAWIEDGFADTVLAYFSQQTTAIGIAAIASNCKDAKGNMLTYAQVAWALAYKSSNRISAFLALPESDAELADASQLSQQWG